MNQGTSELWRSPWAATFGHLPLKAMKWDSTGVTLATSLRPSLSQEVERCSPHPAGRPVVLNTARIKVRTGQWPTWRSVNSAERPKQ